MKSILSLINAPLIISVVLPIGGGFASAIGTMESVRSDWYKKELKKPSWNPPNWIFGPVWTSLYFMIGLASYRVYQQSSQNFFFDTISNSTALQLYLGQLGLNFLWSHIFFNMRNLGLASLEIGTMWVAIVLTIKEFYEVDPIASYLMVPYLLWVSFASFLTMTIWNLNRPSKKKD